MDQWDKDHYFPYKEAISPKGELGFWGTVIPEEDEGEDMGWLAAMIVSEEIARACGMDAGFGRGTKGRHVASFIVGKMMGKRNHPAG